MAPVDVSFSEEAKVDAEDTVNEEVEIDVIPKDRSGAAAAITSASDKLLRFAGAVSACRAAAAALAAAIAASAAADASATAAASAIQEESLTRFTVCGTPPVEATDSTNALAFRFFKATGAFPPMSNTQPQALQTDAGVDFVSFSSKAASAIA